MNRYKPYAAALLAIYVLVALPVFWFGFTTPEYQGDLTRLGGYREDLYGWNQAQQRYQPPLFTPDHYAPDTDIFVLGDSMTVHRPGEQTDPGVYWPNALMAQSGWKVSALHRREHTVEDVLAMPEYRAHPPRLFVLEIAERTASILARLTEMAARRHGCERVAPAPVSLLPAPQALPVQAQSFARPQARAHGLDLSLGGHRLKHVLLRTLAPESIDTLRFHLDRDDLFSSQRPQELLVFRDDLEKMGLSDDFLRQQSCALEALQREVEADGRTRFVLLMVPDKLSAYRRYVRDFPQGHYPEVIPLLASNPGLRMPRVDLAFAKALDSGTRDLYLPNDTHLGSAGQRLLADTLLAELRGVERPATP